MTQRPVPPAEIVAQFPKIISVDDHVVEPPNLWVDRLPAKYRDVGPHVVRGRAYEEALAEATNGGSYDYSNAFTEDPDAPEIDSWVYEDVVVPNIRLGSAAGFSRDEMTASPITFDGMRAGCYDPVERVKDMEQAGIEVSLCFPNMFVRFCGQRFLFGKDKELAQLCVEAYNDWIVEDWAGGSNGRLVPLAIVPLWDPELAAAEVRRMAGRGVTQIAFSENPTKLGLPSIYTDHWGPFFGACDEAEITLQIHIGSSSSMPTTSDDAPAGVGNTLTFVNAAGSMLDWIFSGKLATYRNIQLSFAEAQAGWLPYVLERADVVYDYNRAWNNASENLKVAPSEIFRERMYACLFEDTHGLQCLDEIGADNVVFETDYPHADSTWPECREVAARLTKDLSDVNRWKVLRGNAIRMLKLDLPH